MALPTHRIAIFKRMGAEEWSNDYLVTQASMNAAAAAAEVLITFERNIHATEVSFAYYIISTMAKGDRIFRHQAINLGGLAGAIGVLGLPLYCTLRFDMTTLDSDPCRKYFRLPVPESTNENGTLTSGSLTTYNGLGVTYFVNTLATTKVVSGKGNAVTGASFHSQVQMRQLHRRKRPKDKPVVIPL